ncbi:hypothetical protein BC833DRAFT_597603 [Globomyces pollinis-pini]|nr:hypothetical protein BC833DRAFT_597603 [Globomyces pollinis-pini]
MQTFPIFPSTHRLLKCQTMVMILPHVQPETIGALLMYTTSVREHLQSLNVKATFFVIGSNVIKHPEQLLAIHKDGHQIGIHTWSHTPLTTLSNDQIISEVVWTAKAIKEVTGVTPRYVRCPEGDIDNRVRAVLKAMGLRIVWWNRDSKDYTLISSPSAAAGIERVFQQWASEGKQGTISLQHDIHPLAVEKSGPTLKTVANAGYKIKTIASCLNDANPYSDSLLSRLNLNTVVTTTIPVITTTINSQTQSTTTTLPPVANIKDPIVTGTNQSPTPTAKPNSASLQSWNHLIISISIIFYALYF